MKKFVSIAVIFISSILVSCTSVDVSTDFDSSSDFTKLKTFKWHTDKISAKTDDARMVNELMDKRIRSTIERQLELQGFNKENEIPDFLISYSVTTEDKINFHTYHPHGGYGPGWGWGAGYGYRGMSLGVGYTETVAREYKSGTLIIDVSDQKDDQLVWRGIGSKALPSTLTPEKLDELVSVVVKSILTNFPPEPNKP